MRSMVEGAPTPARVYDSENDALKVVEHFRRWNAHGRETQGFDISVARRVPFGAIASIVRFAIHLDGQPCQEAGEVEGERSLGALLAKPVTAGPLLQRPPQETLRRARLPTQLACELHRPDRSLQRTRAPSTSLRLVPLPVPGRSSRHPRLLWMSAVRSVVHTTSSLWLSIRCSNVTIPASGRDFESLSAITSVSARSVSPMKTGLGIRTLS